MLKEFFSYSKKEQYGIFVLLLIIVLGILFLIIYPKINAEDNYDYSSFKDEIDSFMSSTNSEHGTYIKDSKKLIEKKKPNLFKFNPNTLSKDGWINLGFSEKQFNVIDNYIKKGGEFNVRKDLMKIYSISSSDYNRIEDYIDISPKQDAKTEESIVIKENKNHDSFSIDVNSATEIDLATINGIGETLSKRIIKYRDLLGGFYDINQLKEVYGIKLELYEKIKHHILIDENKIDKLNVNKLSTSKLSKHPYISYETAKSIVSARKVLGDFSSLIEIKSHIFVVDSIVIRLNNYLKFD